MHEISRAHHLRWPIAVVSLGALAGAVGNLVVGQPLWAVAAFAVSVGSFAEFVVPKIVLRSDTVLIRKAVRSREIELRTIETVVVDPYAVHFTLTDGSRVHSSALQTGLIFRWLGKDSGADRFAKKIAERARTLRDGPADE